MRFPFSLVVVFLVVPGLMSAQSASLAAPAADRPQSQWVYFHPGGGLTYGTTKGGDHIVDFSFAGYRGGGVALPKAPVAESISPSGGEDSSAVQAALDRVGAKALKEGHPLALQLTAGTFHLGATLHLNMSNVVLRGAGRDVTILELTGKPHFGIQIGLAAKGAASEDDDAPEDAIAEPVNGPHTTLADVYIPSSTRTLPVVSSQGIKPGDTIVLRRTIPPEYRAFMGMDHLVRDGKAETWLGSSISTERRVLEIRGNELWLDVPITDDFDPRFGGGAGTTVSVVAPPARSHDNGVEDMTLRAPSSSVDYHNEHFDAVQVLSAEDVWMRNLALIDTVNFVRIEAAARRMTIDRVDLTEDDTVNSAARPFGFSLGGTQTLVMRSTAHGNKLTFAATQARMQGPNVVLDCDFYGDGALEPHQRWSTGFLVDNTRVHGGEIRFINRGEMGSGHGWTIGWSVLWNSTANVLTVQEPPGSMNWVIGSSGVRGHQGMPIKGSRGHNGPPLPEGIYDSYGHPVQPVSLYLQQLSNRLGPEAVHNIGW